MELLVEEVRGGGPPPEAPTPRHGLSAERWPVLRRQLVGSGSTGENVWCESPYQRTTSTGGSSSVQRLTSASADGGDDGWG